MKSNLKLIFFVALLFVASVTVNANPRNSIIVILDLDRMLLKDKHMAIAGDLEYFQPDGKPHRLAAFAPEFFLVLRDMRLGHELLVNEINFFSGGGRERNEAVHQLLRVNDVLMIRDLVRRTYSFEHLTPTELVPVGRDRFEFGREILAGRGQDGVPFFDFFKKDLAQFENQPARSPVSHTILIDDNTRAVFPEHVRNVVVVARPDYVDEDLSRLGSSLPKAVRSSPGKRDPVQVARAKYRLVRTAGILDLAREMVEKNIHSSIPAALDELQWDKDGHFRAERLNTPEIYRRGMDLMRKAYLKASLDKPVLERTEQYFQIEPLQARKRDCGHIMSTNPSPQIFPWRT